MLKLEDLYLERFPVGNSSASFSKRHFIQRSVSCYSLHFHGESLSSTIHTDLKGDFGVCLILLSVTCLFLINDCFIGKLNSILLQDLFSKEG